MFAPSREPVEEFALASITKYDECHRHRNREVLGPTGNSKAPLGTIRREFGETIIVNAAHASDSQENAKREMDIIRIAENNLSPLIQAHLC